MWVGKGRFRYILVFNPRQVWWGIVHHRQNHGELAEHQQLFYSCFQWHSYLALYLYATVLDCKYNNSMAKEDLNWPSRICPAVVKMRCALLK